MQEKTKLSCIATRMEDADLRCLEIEQSFEDISKILRRFIETNLETFSFDDFNRGGKKQTLMNVIFKLLENKDASSCHVLCLDCLRILSRDKAGLGELIDERKMRLMLRLAEISATGETVKTPGLANADIVLATLKPLCNLVYNSPVCAALASHAHAAEGILARLCMYAHPPGVPLLIKIFDMKLLFLITALTPETCPKLKEDHHGVTYLIEALGLILKQSTPMSAIDHRVRLDDGNVDLCCEMLKVLFNLMTRRAGYGEEDTEEEGLWQRFIAVLHDILVSQCSQPKQEDLRSNAINLLTSVPVPFYKDLIPSASEGQLEFEGRNVEAIEALIQYLLLRLTVIEKSKSRQDFLSPILSVLAQLARNYRVARKYIKSRILPPLHQHDVISRPEVGENARAQLCRLLTSHSVIVKDLAADLLFTLCKRNVERMVKYTGYGNAAGLLASRGLMGRGTTHSSSSSYSSDSDSETEDYAEVADQINPVLGCCESPKQLNNDNMTEEQKEYEAVKLANLIDRLSRKGIIQPCKIGDDGKPCPVEHVLELQEQLPLIENAAKAMD